VPTAHEACPAGAMAKSIRSKVKRRFRTAKRGVVKRTVTDDRSKPILKKLARATEGAIDAEIRPRNAFRSDAADAVFPQHTFTPCTDFRSEKVVDARYATSGNRRETHPIHLASAAGGEAVLSFGADAAGDAEELADAKLPAPFEDDRMNYDGTTKSSSRQRRRTRNKSGAQQEAGAGGYSFWGNKSGKMGKR